MTVRLILPIELTIPGPIHEELVSVRVALRVRPILPWEELEAAATCIQFVSDEQVELGNHRSFTLDYVFPPTSTQRQVFDTAVLPLVDRVFEGYNATVLAYGQTGSGKTFTMGSGKDTMELPMEDQGIIPIMIDQLFRGIAERRDKAQFQMRVSFLELYNEELRDLLRETPICQRARSAGTLHREGDDFVGVERTMAAEADGRLAVHDTPDGNGVFVLGLSEVGVATQDDLVQALQQGSFYRTVGAHNLNLQSSRSHAIFTIKLMQRPAACEGPAEDHVMSSKLHFVDLAGSERQKRTKAEGERFREGIHINTGLLILGNVISALGEIGKAASDGLPPPLIHVNYRDSKLTRLLQDSLGGNSRTVMIACVSPADTSFEETLNTLKYADRARKIVNKPIQNVDPVALLIQQLRRRVSELEAELRAVKAVPSAVPLSPHVSPPESADARQLETELSVCHTRIDDLSSRLERAHLERDYALLQADAIEMGVERLPPLGDVDDEYAALTIADIKFLFAEDAPSPTPPLPHAPSPLPDSGLALRRVAADNAAMKVELASQQAEIERLRAANKAAAERRRRRLRAPSMPPLLPTAPVETEPDMSDGTQGIATRLVGGLLDSIYLSPHDVVSGIVCDIVWRAVGDAGPDDVIAASHGMAASLVAEMLFLGAGEGREEESGSEDEIVGREEEEEEDEEEVEEEEEEEEESQEPAPTEVRLTQLQRDIEAKEALLAQIEASERQLAVLRLRYESRLRKMADEVKALEHERDTVLFKMEEQSEVTAAEKASIRSKYERRMRELKHNMQTLQGQMESHARLRAEKRRSEVRAESLAKDIHGMKRERERLAREAARAAKRVARLEMDVQRKTAQLEAASKRTHDRDESLKAARRELRAVQKELHVARQSIRRQAISVPPLETLGSTRSHARWLDDRLSGATRRSAAAAELERLTHRRERVARMLSDADDDDESLEAEMAYVKAKVTEAQDELAQGDETAGDISLEALSRLRASDARGILRLALLRLIRGHDETRKARADVREQRAAMAEAEAATRSARAEASEARGELKQMLSTHESEVFFLMDQLEAVQGGDHAVADAMHTRQVAMLTEKLKKYEEDESSPPRAPAMAIPPLRVPETPSPRRRSPRPRTPSDLDAVTLPQRPATAMPWRRGAGRVPAQVAAAMQAARNRARQGQVESPLVPLLGAPATPDAGAAPADQSMATLSGHDGPVLALAGLGGSALISASADRSLRLWNVAAQQETGFLAGHRGMVRAVAWIPERGLVVSGSQDKTVRVWSADSGTCVRSISVGAEVYDIAVDHAFSRFFVSLDDARVLVFDLATFGMVKALSGRQRGSVFCVGVGPQHVFTGARDHSVSVFARDTLKHACQLVPLHYDCVSCLAVSDGVLFTGSRDKSVKAWAMGDTVRQTVARSVHGDWVTSLCMHQGFLHAGCKDTRIAVLNPSDLTPHTKPLYGHDGPVTCMATMPQSAGAPVLVSGSQDRMVKLWTSPREEVAEEEEEGGIETSDELIGL